MKRIYENSTIDVCSEEELKDYLDNGQILKIIQIEYVGNKYVVEHYLNEELIPLNPIASEGQAHNEPDDTFSKILEYKATILNKDPFMGFDGYSLGDIMASPEWPEWSTRVIKEMKNKYIRERVQFLLDNSK